MTPIIYSAAELAWIKKHCTWPRVKAHKKFCAKFGRSDVRIENYVALCKRNNWRTGRTGQYPKGAVPLNKGKKCAPGKGGNSPNARKTQFKKGAKPHNTKPVGHEYINVKDGYTMLSIPEKNPHNGHETRFVLKHKYLWEKKNGKLPAGMCLKCVDGNRQNTDPSNWTPISRGTLPLLNGRWSYKYDEMPAELKPTVLALAKVKSAKSNAKKGKEQRP